MFVSVFISMVNSPKRTAKDSPVNHGLAGPLLAYYHRAKLHRSSEDWLNISKPSCRRFLKAVLKPRDSFELFCGY